MCHTMACQSLSKLTRAFSALLAVVGKYTKIQGGKLRGGRGVGILAVKALGTWLPFRKLDPVLTIL